MKNRLLLLALTALCLCLSGCVYRSYQEGTAKYVTLSIGTKQGVAAFSLEAGAVGTDSYRKLDSKGLTNDPTNAVAVVDAAVTAAIRAAK